MPSIIYTKETSNSKEKILSYCKEPPSQILDKIFKTYSVYKYEKVIFPIDTRLSGNYPELAICYAKEPPETMIIGTIQGIELTSARINQPSTEEDYKEALKEQLKGNWWKEYQIL